MPPAQLHEAKIWFEHYVGTFADDAGDLHSFLQMKAAHSNPETAKGDAMRRPDFIHKPTR